MTPKSLAKMPKLDTKIGIWHYFVSTQSFHFKSCVYDLLPHFLSYSSLLLLPNLSEIRQSENGNNVWHYHTNWMHYGCPKIVHEQLVQEMGSSFSPWYMTFASLAPLMSPHSKKSLTSGCYLASKSGSLRLTRIWAPKDQVQLKKGALRQDLSKGWATKSPSTYPTKKEIFKDSSFRKTIQC